MHPYIMLALLSINALFGIVVALKTGQKGPAVTTVGLLIIFVLFVVAEAVRVTP